MKTLNKLKEKNIKISDQFFVFDTETNGLRSKSDAFIFGILYGENTLEVFYTVEDFKKEFKKEKYKGSKKLPHLTIIYLLFVAVLLPALFVTFKLTVYVPAFVYLCVGLWAVEVLLSPKFHVQDAGLLVLVSVKVTVNGAFPERVDAVKEATGVFNTFTTM